MTRKAHTACQRMKAIQSQTLDKKGRQRENLKKREKENEIKKADTNEQRNEEKRIANG